MNRPGPWDLLDVPADPLPGWPEQVAIAQTKYAQLANDIQTQVSQLRQMSSETNALVGQFAPAMREKAEGLAELLERSEARFVTVAAQLRVWQPVLEEGRAVSGRLLLEAEEADSRLRNTSSRGATVDPADPVAVENERIRVLRHGEARADLEATKASFRALMDRVNQAADEVARKIRDSSDDSLKNGGIDGIRQWIHENKKLLTRIADVLSFIATAIAIAALVVGTGGLGLAALLTLGALLAHTLLAANGDGSWADVALDAFALATFGAGRVVTSGAKTALALREGMGAYTRTVSTARMALSKARGLNKVMVWFTKANPLSRTFNGLVHGLERTRAIMGTQFKSTSFLARLRYGDAEAAGLGVAIEAAARKYGPGVLMNSARTLMGVSNFLWRSSFAVDLGAKLAGGFDLGGAEFKGFCRPWVDWKDQFTVPLWKI